MTDIRIRHPRQSSQQQTQSLLSSKFANTITFIDNLSTFSSSSSSAANNDGCGNANANANTNANHNTLISFSKTQNIHNHAKTQTQTQTLQKQNAIAAAAAVVGFGGPNDATTYTNRRRTSSKSNASSAVDADDLCTNTSHYTTDLAGNMSDIALRVLKECDAKKLLSARLIRAPSDYYDRPLEWRRDFLKAPDVKYLCKSLLLENTKCANKHCENPFNARYYLVIFQYIRKLNSENVMKLVRQVNRSNGGKEGKRQFNFRLASEADNARETGYEHNGVTPIAMENSQIPIILSAELLKLGHIWIGAGEFDVKLAVDVSEFRNVYRPFVGKICFD